MTAPWRRLGWALVAFVAEVLSEPLVRLSVFALGRYERAGGSS